jgi:hypothetical protein
MEDDGWPQEPRLSQAQQYGIADAPSEELEALNVRILRADDERDGVHPKAGNADRGPLLVR